MRITIDRNTIMPDDLKLSDKCYDIVITDTNEEAHTHEAHTRLVSMKLQRLADLMIETGIFVKPDVFMPRNKIEAIKRVRELFSLDLRTAKEFVDRFVPPTI